MTFFIIDTGAHRRWNLHLKVLTLKTSIVSRPGKRVYSFDTAQEKHDKFLGHGIGVSGGAMTGRIVFTLEEIQHWRKTEPKTSLIIVRGDTVPDDIREIHEADGLLTARGGSTSHAAIVAHR